MDEAFKQFLDVLLSTMDVKKVSVEDAETLLKTLKKNIEKLDIARRGFTHETVQLDPRGRFVIPQNFRSSLDINPKDVLDCQLYPPDKPKGIFIRKEQP
jgi:rRNA pseudouridine-1189 N-methylase Emg1 (Nep1/Mra1 family)